MQHELLSVEASNELYAFSTIQHDGMTSIHMTQAPHEEHQVPDVMRSNMASIFSQTAGSALFVSKSPRVASYLASQGFAFSYEKQTDGGTIIDATYPTLDIDALNSNAASPFIAVPESSYSADSFMRNLASGKVSISANPDGRLDMHDSLFHRPLWELVVTVPALFGALSTKAAQVVADNDKLPPRDPHLRGPEEIDLAVTRATAQNKVRSFMGQVDYIISPLGGLSYCITRGSAHELASLLREELFSSPKNHWTMRPQVPDNFVDDAQILAWSQQLVDSFSGSEQG